MSPTNPQPPEIRAPNPSRESRQASARQEFAAWREAHPDFTTRELLDAWARIRRAWGLGPAAGKPR